MDRGLAIRMLLHMAEQLGRERAFVSFNIGRVRGVADVYFAKCPRAL